MSTIGTTTTTPVHSGCGAPASPATAPNPNAQLVGGGFTLPAAVAVPAERFASSMTGGVILGRDGAPAGRIPANSFVDTRDGSIYGPDGKAITLPEGSTVDFFDLPDIVQLMADAKASASGGGQAKGSGPDAKGSGPDAKGSGDTHSHVDGQWGPGGVTPIKGGGAEGCDSGHGSATAAGPATKAGGATGTTTGSTGTTSTGTTTGSTGTTSTGTTTAVAGASGGGATSQADVLAQLTKSITDIMEQVRRLTPTSTSGGGATVAATTGAAQLGSTDLLRLAVHDLVGAVGQLNGELARLGIRGGGPVQFPVPPGKDAPAKDAPPKVAPPVVEPPKTETPKTESSSGSGSSSSDTTANSSSSS